MLCREKRPPLLTQHASRITCPLSQHRFLLLLLIFLLAACQPPEPTPVPIPTAVRPNLIDNPTDEQLRGDEPINQLFPSPAYSVHTTNWWRPEAVAWEMETVSEMGFDWVKHPVAWGDVEKSKTGFDWYFLDQALLPAIESHNLNAILRIDRTPFWAIEVREGITAENVQPGDNADFGDFCFAMAERYKGRVRGFQVWNEPNLDREWGSDTPNPEEYTALLKVCYERIKEADPDAIVISAGLAPTCTNNLEVMDDITFLQGMYDAGAADYFDVLGLNAPGYAVAPETGYEGDYDSSDPADCSAYTFRFRHVEDMRQLMIQNGDSHKQVAILEMGWITNDNAGLTDATLEEQHVNYAWFAVDSDTQAQYLSDAYRYAAEHWQPWIGLMTTVYISDYDWTPEANEQWWWSIVLPDGTKRPAFEALQNLEK